MKKIKWILIGICVFIIGFLGAYVYQQKIKNYRILAIMPSFQRPIFLSGQILRFMNQTYPNFTMSVSVKGIPPELFEMMWQTEWQKFIDDGKLIISWDTNKDQLSNVLDTVRNIDLSQYDYFCKVDDDDWYTPDYLEHVNLELNKKENLALSHSKQVNRIIQNEKGVVFEVYRGDVSSPTMCFSRAVIELALEIERDPKKLNQYGLQTGLMMKRYRNEDSLLRNLAVAIGEEQFRNDSSFFIYGHQYPGISRRMK